MNMLRNNVPKMFQISKIGILFVEDQTIKVTSNKRSKLAYYEKTSSRGVFKIELGMEVQPEALLTTP